MKTIGIDARLYHKTGVGVYIRNLIQQLSRMPSKNISYRIYVMAGDASTIMPLPHMKVIEVPYGWHSFAEQTGFAARLYRDNLDLMHFTYFSYPVLYRRKFVATMHDTILFTNKTGKASTRHPALYYLKHRVFRFVFAKQLRHASQVIVPTEAVRDQILSLFGPAYRDKIMPIHEGIDYEFIEAADRVSHAPIKGKYMMYVGNFYPHKNIERMVRAFSRISGDVRLVLVGPDDFFLARLKKVIETLGIGSRIIYKPDCPLEDLVGLYRHAVALIHPSLSEGFGLPILEAMYCRLPIAASDIPVFHELMGNQYQAFDPLNESDITEKIRQAGLTSSVSYGPRLRDFSFETMARKTYEVYETLLQ